MATKLYVGNLAYGVTDSDLENMFAPHGTVQSAQVIMDRDTGRSKGFGFVEMGNGERSASGHHRPERPRSQRASAHRQRSPAHEKNVPVDTESTAVSRTALGRVMINDNKPSWKPRHSSQPGCWKGIGIFARGTSRPH